MRPLDRRWVLMGTEPATERPLYSVVVELRRSLPIITSEQSDEDMIDAADRRLAPVKVPPPLDEVVVAELSEREKSEERLLRLLAVPAASCILL